MKNESPMPTPRTPNKNIISVFRNSPKNRETTKNVIMFLIGRTLWNNDANPTPNNRAIGIRLKNLRAGTVIPRT